MKLPSRKTGLPAASRPARRFAPAWAIVATLLGALGLGAVSIAKPHQLANAGFSAAVRLLEAARARDSILVSSVPALKAALASAREGGHIRLAPGDYDSLIVMNQHPSRPLVIEPADPRAPARIGLIRIANSSNIEITGLEIGRALRPGEADTLQYAVITDSDQITLAQVFVHGSLDQDVSNDGRGIRVIGGRGIRLIGSRFQQLRLACAFFDVDDIVFAYNSVTQAREGVDIAGADNVLIENNLFREMGSLQGEHTDGVQFFTTHAKRGVSNAAIKNNGFLFSDNASARTQGLFVSSQVTGIRHRNISVINNVYYGSGVHGLSLSNTDGAALRSNTVLTFPNNGKNGREITASILLNAVTAGVVENNVTSNLSIRGCDCTIGKNILIRSAKIPRGTPMSELFGARQFELSSELPAKFALAGASRRSAIGFQSGDIAWGVWNGRAAELIERYPYAPAR